MVLASGCDCVLRYAVNEDQIPEQCEPDGAGDGLLFKASSLQILCNSRRFREL